MGLLLMERKGRDSGGGGALVPLVTRGGNRIGTLPHARLWDGRISIQTHSNPTRPSHLQPHLQMSKQRQRVR